MKKSLIGKLGVAAVTLLLGCLFLASAQEGTDKKGAVPAAQKEATKAEPAIASRFHEDTDPDYRSPSSVSFKKDDQEVRVVGISPQLKTSKNYVPGLRFHKILGALAQRDAPIEEGLPPVIDGIRRNPDGSVWLRFRVIVSTPEFLKRCRDAVLADERELLAKEHLTQDDIKIEPWPLKHCVVSAQDAFTKEVIAVSQTGSLTAMREEFSFTMPFSPKDFRKVIGLISSGELEFVYSYSYVGSTEYKGSVDLKGVKNAKLIASQKLRSEQLEGKEPIFQWEADEAIRHVSATVEKTYRVGHRDLLPLLDTPNLFHKLFADDGQITFKDLKEGDGKTAQILAAYLKPHLEQVRESSGTDKADITIHEDMSATITDKNSSKSSKTQQVLDRLEHATGSKWVKEKTESRYRPHSIKKLKFQSGADQVVIDEKTTVFLSVGRQNLYLEDTPIPVTFTSKTVGMTSMLARSSDLGPYEGVPIGMMVPFFGKKLPKGYRWAKGISEDPKNVFPNAEWVPEHLKGEPLPDMREHLVGGAKDEPGANAKYEKFVGKIYKEGGVQVDGKNFSLSDPTLQDLGLMKGPFGNDVLALSYNVRDKQVGQAGADERHNHYVLRNAGNGEYRQQFNAVQVAMKTNAYQKLLNGSATVRFDSAATNPRHIMCRWIIRVE